MIQFNGMLRKDLIHKVASVDAVIMPSLSDGFGLVAAEVSSLDVPLIISHTASLPEVAS
ncbi:glycosyltransferase family 4 protein [bacterium]|nr:glycosyltransferase family 4 protein [bacterium]